MSRARRARCYASEVRENFEQVGILHMAAEVAKFADGKVSGEESDGYEGSLVPDGILNPPEDVTEEDVQGVMLDHSILHLPKRADCPVCQEGQTRCLAG
jgi:hypothetical protein